MITFLHTMIRVSDLDATLSFFSLLGLEEVRRKDSEKGRFTLVFLAALIFAPKHGLLATRRLRRLATQSFTPTSMEKAGIMS